MGDQEGTLSCENCGRESNRSDAIRRKTMGNLDPDRWQTFCCPHCGHRIKTVFVDL